MNVVLRFPTISSFLLLITVNQFVCPMVYFDIYILARTCAMTSLLRSFPEADFGTLLVNVTFLNLLNGATYKGKEGDHFQAFHCQNDGCFTTTCFAFFWFYAATKSILNIALKGSSLGKGAHKQSLITTTKRSCLENFK